MSVSDQTSRRVVIIGAGVAGLAAAFRLLQLRPQWHVELIEECDRPGGLATSMRNEEFSADLGPHRVFTELPEIQRLLPELIEPAAMLTVQRRSELLLRGHLYRYPVRATELLRHMGPLRVARLASSALAARFRPKHPDESYEDAMIRAFGRAGYAMLIEPYTRKVWKSDPAALSGEIARVRVSAGSSAKLMRKVLMRKDESAPTALASFAYIRGGVEGLVRSLVHKVEQAGGTIRTRTEATGFRCEAGRIRSIRTPGGEISADCIISTAPVTDLTRLLQECGAAPDAVRAAGGLVYIGLVLVGIILRRKQMSPNSWIYFPEEDLIFNRSYEPKNLDPSMAPPDKTMGVFEVTARWDSDLWKSPDDEIVRRVCDDAVRTGVVRREDIESAFAQRVPHTYPLYTMDFRDRLRAIFGWLRGIPNLVTTGRQGLFNHNNMDHSMLMGIRAAECVEGNDSPAQAWYDNLTQFDNFRIVD